MLDKLTQQELKTQIGYNQDTGIFTWLLAKQRVAIGDIAGSLSSNGYVVICINNKDYLAHRLAWLYMTGCLPKEHVDHKDGEKTNNRWGNIRLATRSQNRMNSKLQSNNKSGFKGVCWCNTNKKWLATAMLNKKQKHLGYFSSPELASSAYQKFAHEMHGEFYCDRGIYA